MSVWALITMTALAQGFIHYFPWRSLLRDTERASIASHVAGMLGLALPFTAWLVDQCYERIAVVLWQGIAGAAAMIVGLSILDRFLALDWGLREAHEREDVYRGKNGQA